MKYITNFKLKTPIWFLENESNIINDFSKVLFNSEKLIEIIISILNNKPLNNIITYRIINNKIEILTGITEVFLILKYFKSSSNLYLNLKFLADNDDIVLQSIHLSQEISFPIYLLIDTFKYLDYMETVELYKKNVIKNILPEISSNIIDFKIPCFEVLYERTERK